MTGSSPAMTMTCRVIAFQVALLPLVVAGCTLDAGSWFAVLSPTFEGRYVTSADRNVGDGWEKLNTNYQARITRALVTVRDVQLQELGESAGGDGAFDPANPPARYSLCHNGHCHRDDGALVPYEEIAVEIAGGGATTGGAARAVVALPVGETNLLAPQKQRLTCTPDCRLGQAQIRRARATLTGVELEGLVRDNPAVAPRIEGELRWRWVGAFTANQTDGGATEPRAVALDCVANLPADNAHPPAVTLVLTLEARAKLLDDIEWGALSRVADFIDFAEPANGASRALLQGNLAELDLAAAITRAD